MAPLLSRVRRFARDVQHDIWPTPEIAMLQELERRAQQESRRTAGRIVVPPYDLEYADAMSTWPQWDDIFIRQALAFETDAPAPRIIDCGANVGLASLYYRRRYPRARITSIEADPTIADLCRRNLTRHDEADADVRTAAAWTTNGAVEFMCEGADSGTIATFDRSRRGTVHSVPAVRLRDLLDEPVDLLKMDIEGAELAVLRDCAGALRNVAAIALDVHEFDPACRQTGAIFELLREAGYTFGLSNLCPLPWRASEEAGPFPSAPPIWAVAVFAWRR